MPRNPPSQSKQAFALLDHFSVEDMQKWDILRKKILRFYWDYYHDLAFQRSEVSREINFSLLNAAVGPFEFSEWQRMVKLKYSVDPLSIEGSLIDPGGRFNIGDINPTLFPPFPALYIASDKETALQEALCQTIRNDHDKQQALDLALANSTSITNISLSGYLDSYIDLTRPKRLQSFLNHIKGFTIQNQLISAAKEIGLPPPVIIQNTTELKNVLLYRNWRDWPMQFDVPATSQIFGQLVANSGIEGILYRSKFNENNCLVIFPQNLDSGSNCFVQLDDEPPAETKIHRIDAQVWNEHYIKS